MDMKTCNKCGNTKGLFAFHKQHTTKDGLRNCCKDCDGVRKKEYYQKNKDRLKAYSANHKKTYIPLYDRDINSRLRQLCEKAKKRNKEFSLIPQYLYEVWEKQSGQCAYTKLPMVATSNQFNTVSIDRIDSSIGYVEGNIQLVCTAINRMKREYIEDVFLLLCHSVAQNSKLSELPEVLLARHIPLGTLE